MTAFVISNAGGNFNVASSYVANSGTPVAGDTITATGTSGNLTVTATAACASIDFTNYTGTFTINSGQVITLTSTLKLVSGMNVSGTGTMTLNGTATITSAGKSIPWGVTINGVATYTLADDWTVTGATNIGGTITMNTHTWHAQGSYVVSSGTVGGTTTISVEGTTWTASGGTSNIATTLAPSGTLTVSGTIQWGTGTLTYSSGTVSFGTSTLTLNGSCTFNLGNSAHLANLTIFAASLTITLSADLYVDSTLTLPNGNCTFAGAFNISVLTLTSATLSGTRTWTLVASQTLSLAYVGVSVPSITLAGIVGGHGKFVSSSPGTKTKITLAPGTAENIYLIDATDVDS